MTYRFALTVVLVVAGCAQPPLTPTPHRNAPLDAATLALSCSEIKTRNDRITVRLKQLEQESKARARTQAITDTIVGAGMSAVIGVGARGGIDGLRAASATVQGVEMVRAAERGNGSMQEVSDVLALAGRSSELQRAMIEKGC